MNRNLRFSLTKLYFSVLISLAAPLGYADIKPNSQNSEMTNLIIISITILLILSGIFLVFIQKIISNKNIVRDKLQKLQTKNDELLNEKHQWLESEVEILNTNVELEKRIVARTETVNKVNHELTKALEALHQQAQTLDSLITALEYSDSKILIIDKHYRVCFASKCFLQFTGLALSDIKDQPLKRLEKHICLPEMASNGLTLNKDGLIDTQLKCLDKQGISHWLDARIALSWSELKEIIHYVIIFDSNEEFSSN
jgi:transcriptional regulator with PAS, ATPase and Fis domain